MVSNKCRILQDFHNCIEHCKILSEELFEMVWSTTDLSPSSWDITGDGDVGVTLTSKQLKKLNNSDKSASCLNSI